MTLEFGKEVIRAEARAVSNLLERLDDAFARAVETIIACPGRVVVTGMGKPWLIGQKISATLASTGTPSLSLHPAEAIHGDLGRVTRQDIVLALSNSGESEEIVRLLDPIKKIGATLIAMTGRTDSTLARYAEIVLDIGRIEEACPLGLAPSASTTAMLAYGDALALTVCKARDFDAESYAAFHPGGALGRKLMKVHEVMRTGDRLVCVPKETTVLEILAKITKARSGAACIVADDGSFVGLYIESCLRHRLENDPKFRIDKEPVGKLMIEKPATIAPDRLVSEAVGLILDKHIDDLPVVDANGLAVGLLDAQDLVGWEARGDADG